MNLLDLYSRDLCHVCGQTPCNCTHIVESADPQSRKLGRIISRIYNEIYDMGDDALDYLNDRAAVWAELWDRYEGDIDSIIAEEDPVTLGKAALELKDILNDLQSDQGVAEGFFGIDDKIKGKIQNIVSRLSDEYGMWDHKAQTFTPDGLEHLKSILKFNDKYIKYALSLTSRDFEAEGVAEGSEQIYNILALDKGNALKKPTKLKWKASSLEDIFDALAAQDWYPLEINGIEVIAGKRLKQGVAEGSEFGAYYYEQLAQQTFDINPNLQDENEILNLGYKIAKGELGSRAQGMFRDEDFPSDFVSAYGYLKKQSVAEEKVRLDPKCWSGKKIGNPKTKMKGGVRVNNCVPAESVAEASPEATFNALKGLKSWQVVIMNNYYRGKYSDYSGRYFYVLATSPEQAQQVVLDNADAILKDLLAMKAHNGRSILPRNHAVRITSDRIGRIEDGTEHGRLSTSGFKKMYSPQGVMMVKLNNGAIEDVQSQEQGVAEAVDSYEFHTSVPMGDFRPSKYGKEKYLYLHDLTRKSGDGSGPMLVTVERPGTAVEIANEFGGKAVKTKLGTYRIVQPVTNQQGVAEVSDETLTSYLTKVDADSQKHPMDPSKRSPEKASKSVGGFARAFNKLDARKKPVNEIDPNNYDSDEDYYRDLEAGRYQGVPKKPYNPDWDADDEEFMQKWYREHGLEEQGARGPGRPVAGEWDSTSGKIGRTEKTATGIRHHADPSRYGGTEPDAEDDHLLSRAQINKLGRATEPVDENAPEEKEADYGKSYQDMVKRMGAKAREQEQSRPVDIGALARKLRDIEHKDSK